MREWHSQNPSRHRIRRGEKTQYFIPFFAVGDNSITIGITPLALEHTATVAINDFLVSGRETNLGFLPLDNHPDFTLVSTNCDIRTALLDQLRRRCGAPEVLGPTSKGM